MPCLGRRRARANERPCGCPPHLRHELEKFVAEDGTVQLGAGPSWLRPVTARWVGEHPACRARAVSVPHGLSQAQLRTLLEGQGVRVKDITTEYGP